MLYVALGVLVVLLVVVRRRTRRSLTWAERGEPRGRTVPGQPKVHAAGAEPEATLHIKVIRADGTVEDHGTVAAQVTRRR
jgi:hypothetical protein